MPKPPASAVSFTAIKEWAQANMPDEVAAMDYPAIADAINAKTEITTPTIVPVIRDLYTLLDTITDNADYGNALASSVTTDILLPALQMGGETASKARQVSDWMVDNSMMNGYTLPQLAMRLISANAQAEIAALLQVLPAVGILSAGTAAAIGEALGQTETIEIIAPGPSIGETNGWGTVKPSTIQKALQYG